MRFKKSVSIARDISTMLDYSPSGCLGVHNHIVIQPTPAGPVPTPMPMMPSMELPLPMLWPPGYLMGQNKFSSTVYHNNLWIALEGYDTGIGIVHVCLVAPPPCIVIPMHILDSSRKAKFKVSDVKADGKAIATCTMFDIAPPTPLLVCGSVPTPTAGTGTAVAFNSLKVGMHWIDVVAGWADVIITCVMAFFKARANPLEGTGAPALLEPKLMPDAGSIVGGLIRMAGQEWAGFRGDAQVEYKPLQGVLAEVGISVSRDGDTGRFSGEAGARAGVDSTNVHGTGRVSETAEGFDVSGGPGVSTPLGGGDVTRTRHYGADGREIAPAEVGTTGSGPAWPPVTGNPMRGMGSPYSGFFSDL